MSNEKTARIRELNDQFRTSGIGGRTLVSDGVNALNEADVITVLELVRQFAAFDQGNDPYGEHDFGAIERDGQRFFFKIDYYDKELQYGSEDPSDPTQTTRVLTIMLAEEY